MCVIWYVCHGHCSARCTPIDGMCVDCGTIDVVLHMFVFNKHVQHHIYGTSWTCVHDLCRHVDQWIGSTASLEV